MKFGFLLLSAVLVGTASAFVVTPNHGVAVSGNALGSSKAHKNCMEKKGEDELRDIENRFIFNSFEKEELTKQKLQVPPTRGLGASIQEKFDAVMKLWTSPPLLGSAEGSAPLASTEGPVIDKGKADEAETLSDVIINQARGSSMIYTFAKVREFVRKNPKYKWHNPELILKEKGSDKNNNLGSPIKPADVLTFVEENGAILSEIDSTKFNVDDRDEFSTIETLKRLSDIDGYIFEFDDQFSDKELVWALTVNKSRERVTVCFRGSDSIKDWWMDFRAWPKSIHMPHVPQDGMLQTRIRVHRGFHEYLFGQANGHTKFHDISNKIREVYEHEEYAGYQLYVCGHSLGGALASLTAFYLSANEVFKGRPVIAITFASPQAGDNAYSKAFQALESMRHLLHIRISNEGDIFPKLPPAFPLGYTQTGVNLHLHSDKNMEIGYRNLKWRISELSFNIGKTHSLKTHYTHLNKKENQETLVKFKTADRKSVV